jgi:tripartite ATP-independent transporter DctM subunit
MAWALFGAFIGLMLFRVPVTMAIGIAVLGSLIVAGFSSEIYILPLMVVEGVENPSLIAVPFFIMAGNLMNAVGMTDKIFTFAMTLVGHFRAGLAQVNVLASMIFAGVSGAAVADIAGLGMVEIRAMRERGYPADFAAALTVCSAVIGPIIPPSISLVIYAFLSNTSVARLFLAGIVPGLVIGAALMTFNRLIAERRGFPREPRATFAQVRHAMVDGVAALVAPAIILSAIVTGFTTATEAGVLACVYSILLGLFYRTFTWQKLWKALTDTMIITSIIMIIIGYSQVMGWLLAIEQIPQALASMILLTTDNKYVFLLIMLVFLLAIGTVVEGIPAKLILVPMLLPLVDQFGIDRIHFGLIITFALLIGMATPPMGIGLYIVTKVGDVSFERVTMAVIPFYIPLIIVLLLITYVPPLTLWLPDLILGPD